MAIYKYSIDLDERGEFRVHVENSRGRSVWQVAYPSYSCVNCGESQDTCTCENPDYTQDSTIFEDGYMRNKNDKTGLENYLKSLGIMPQSAHLVYANPAEHTRQY